MTDKYAAFHRLHESGCFVIPNPWDVGSARWLEHVGFKALATTSSGFAWSIGRPDYGVKRDDVLAHLAAVAPSVAIPVNADYENGFAGNPEGVAQNVTLAVATGVAGLSIEDSNANRDAPLYDVKLAVERIAAARAAIDKTGKRVVLTGRAECYLVGRTDLKETIARLVAYAEAGADCLYAPGIRSREDIASVVRAVAPKPVNVLVFGEGMNVAELAELGVRRISVGGGLARTAWGGFVAAAKEIMEKGTFEAFGHGASGRDLNAAFTPYADSRADRKT